MRTVTGTRAIQYMVLHAFHKEHATILESDAGIDVDGPRAGRFYETDEEEIDYERVLWTVLNYMPNEPSLRGTGYDMDEGIEAVFRAEVAEREIAGRTTEVILNFRIETGVYYSESCGTNYRFHWEV